MITVREAVTSLKLEYPETSVHGLTDMGSPAPSDLEDVIKEAQRWPQLTDICRKWLSDCPLNKSMRTELDTYTYKDEIERWSGLSWVPHIIVLVAARQLEIPMQRSPNRPYAAILPLGAKRP